MVKNKEQVRHFYYRTWHKISKHIDFANVYNRVLKKSSQELYGLICYAELRKKVGGLMDDKNVAKLNELIQQGATTVRSKGRNLRIKAPMCRALKKLCDPDGVSDEEDQKPVRLPLKVAVELQPRSNYSWARVQTLAHNPRLRHPFSSLKQTLQLNSLKEREALEGSQSITVSPSKGPQEELCLFPSENSNLITLPGVARVVHSKASCTVHWLETGKNRPNAKELPAAQILGIHTAAPRGTSKSGRGSANVGGISAAAIADSRRTEGSNTEPSPDSSGKVDEKKLQHMGLFPEEGNGTGSPETTEVNSGLSANRSTEGSCGVAEISNDPCKEEPNASSSSPETAPTHPAKPAAGGSEEAASQPTKERTVEQIREEGWSARDTDVTLAELYLMFGKPGKLQLEYEWQHVGAPSSNQEDGQPSVPSRPNRTNRVLRCLLKLVQTEVNPKPLVGEHSQTTPVLRISYQEEQNQSITPPGKCPIAGVRSPNCSRQPASVRVARIHSPNTGASGGRNLPRSLLGAPNAGSDAEGGVFAVPTTLPPNSSRYNRMFSPNKEAQLAFRQQLDSISMQSDLFLNRQRKPRNRQLRKPLVVQRTLLPRTTGDTSQHVCSFSILSNSSATGTLSSMDSSFLCFVTVHQNLSVTNDVLSFSANEDMANLLSLITRSGAIDLAAKSAGIIPGSPCPELDSSTVDGALLTTPAIAEAEPDTHLLQQSVPEVWTANTHTRAQRKHITLSSEGHEKYLNFGGRDSLLSPPSVASLLDISLPGPPEEALAPGEPQTQISDSIIELAINSTHYGEEAALSPAKLGNGDHSKLLASSPSVSPSRGWIPSPSHDPQWYPSDSSDSTLGCLLSSMVSPDKSKRTTLTPSGPSSGTALLGPSLLDCNSHDSFQSRGLPDVAEMDSQLACMMSESSVDYIARFNDLAQELNVAAPLTDGLQDGMGHVPGVLTSRGGFVHD
uniref:Cramped chromatin regulator homolog 1 n=1 Tax=Oryzias latipes TaxID=8090 RepID=A0A3P9H3J4_ORYLA